MSNEDRQTQQKLPAYVPVLLAFTSGLGLTIMAVALAMGAVQAVSADSSVIGLTFAFGLALFVLGLAGWFGIVQPHKHFDDINVPQDTGHHSEASRHE